MSKIYHGTHKTWGVQAWAETPKAVCDFIGAPAQDVAIIEMEKTDYLLGRVPFEFRSVLSYMAYERGHASGQEEVENILASLVEELKPCIAAFEKRLLDSQTRTGDWVRTQAL